MNGTGARTLETDRLVLRRIYASDAPAMYNNWLCDPMVARYVSWDRYESLDKAREYAEYKAGLYEGHDFCFDWVMAPKDTNEAIGEIQAVAVSRAHRLVEVGFCLGRDHWNKGYMTEALKTFISYMFNEVQVDKILACHLSVNPSSGRVMQKAGMHLDASLPDYFVDKTTGRRCDKVCYSIDRPITLIATSTNS